MKLMRLWDLRKRWSVQREEKPACEKEGFRSRPEEEGLRRKRPEEFHKQPESEWSAGPQFWQGKELAKQEKKKIARSWAITELCQGRELDYKLYASLGLEGWRGNTNIISPRGCSDAPRFGPQNACVCKFWGIWLSKIPLRWWCTYVEMERQWQLCLLLCWPVLNSTVYSSLKTRCKVLFRLELPSPKQGSSQLFIAIHQNCCSVTAFWLTLWNRKPSELPSSHHTLRSLKNSTF